jgi:hypothetical protein
MDATYFDTFVRAVENTPKRERLGVLGEDYLVFPPQTDYGYEATPRNALTFANMGVDGVHYAILKIDGEVSDESPVIHVGPMDFSEPYVVLADCFINYLAAACGVTMREMEAVFEEERAGRCELVPFLKAHFVHSRLYEEKRLRKLELYLDRVEPRA